MMKSFFKKLSLAMALAMVVTTMAPAGSAFAANAGIALQGTKTVVTEYNVEIGEDKAVDFCFIGAPADWKTTFVWASDNEEVATVDQAGIVTGLKDGVANITITAGADASYKHAVKVTVGKGEAKAYDFEIAQIDTVTAKLTFNKNVDLSQATVEDFAITATYSDGTTQSVTGIKVVCPVEHYQDAMVVRDALYEFEIVRDDSSAEVIVEPLSSKPGTAGTHEGSVSIALRGVLSASFIMSSTPSNPITLQISCGS